MSKARDWLSFIRKDEGGDGSPDATAKMTAAVVTAYKAALAEAGVDSTVSFNLCILGDGDGDGDTDGQTLFAIYDRYADWWILASGDTAEVVAYYSYQYETFCYCDAPDDGVSLELDVEALKKAASKEERSVLVKASTRRKKAIDNVYKILKSADESRYTLGVAYPAAELDAHGDYATAESLEEAAWEFMASGQVIKAGTGVDHAKGTDGTGTVVESYIYRGPDWDVDGQIVKAGDWLLGAIWDDDTWTTIKKGERNGWSIQGTGTRKPVIDEELAA